VQASSHECRYDQGKADGCGVLSPPIEWSRSIVKIKLRSRGCGVRRLTCRAIALSLLWSSLHRKQLSCGLMHLTFLQVCEPPRFITATLKVRPGSLKSVQLPGRLWGRAICHGGRQSDDQRDASCSARQLRRSTEPTRCPSAQGNAARLDEGAAVRAGDGQEESAEGLPPPPHPLKTKPFCVPRS
jgi:hypothetical protein